MSAITMRVAITINAHTKRKHQLLFVLPVNGHGLDTLVSYKCLCGSVCGFIDGCIIGEYLAWLLGWKWESQSCSGEGIQFNDADEPKVLDPAGKHP